MSSSWHFTVKPFGQSPQISIKYIEVCRHFMTKCRNVLRLVQKRVSMLSEHREAEGRRQAGGRPGGSAQRQRVGDGVRRPLEPAVRQRRVSGAGLRQRQGSSDGSPHGTRWALMSRTTATQTTDLHCTSELWLFVQIVNSILRFLNFSFFRIMLILHNIFRAATWTNVLYLYSFERQVSQGFLKCLKLHMQIKYFLSNYKL